MAVRQLPKLDRVGQGLRVAAYIDVETTGLSPAFDEVVEFAIVLFAFDPVTGDIAGIVDEYVGLRDPGRPIPPEATAVHGIRDADVRGKRLDDRRIRSLIERAEFLVAHNAPFDRGFVERLFPEARGKPWHCSMREVPWKALGFASRGLQKLLAAHDIRVSRAHRGLDDVHGALTLLASAGPSGRCYFRYIVERHDAAMSKAAPQAELERSVPVEHAAKARGKGAAVPERAEQGRLWNLVASRLKALLDRARRRGTGT